MPLPRRPYTLVKSLYPRTLLLFQQHFDWRITGRWMLYSALVGVLGALAAIVFTKMVDVVAGFALAGLVGYPVPLPGGEAPAGYAFDVERALRPTSRWLLFVVPAAGGLLTGWIVYKLAPEAEGHGTDAVIHAFHHRRGEIRPRVPLVKMVASALTIGTGGSAGREGPIAQIGAALGSFVADRLGLGERERRMLLVAGVAAGVGSIFRSPLGGAFFAVEVLYREDLETEALMPAVVSAITGYSLYSYVEGSTTVFLTPHFRFVNPLELLPLILFAFVCAVVGVIFARVFFGAKRQIFDRIPIPAPYKPAVGGVMVGAIAFFFSPVLGSSYGWLQQAIDGQLPVALMAALVAGKIVATSLTIGSGGSGGVFAPSLVIGGMLGGIYGAGLSALFPSVVTQPEAYVMIGMASFMTGTANVPISTTVMISEMTGSYTLLVPLLFTNVIAHVLTRRWSLYHEQVRTLRDSPAHRMELTPDLLAATRVGQFIEHPVHHHLVEPSHTLDEMLSVFTRTREVILPVVADAAAHPLRYRGLVLLDDAQSLLQSDETLRHLIVARDLEVPFVAVRLDDTLDRVLDLFLESQYPELPVLDADGAIVGFVRQNDVISEYYRAYLRKKQAEESHPG